MLFGRATTRAGEPATKVEHCLRQFPILQRFLLVAIAIKTELVQHFHHAKVNRRPALGGTA